MQQDHLLTPSDLAVLLGVPVATLYNWRYEDRSSWFQVGRHLRYRQSDVDNWLNEQRQATGS